MALAYSQYLLLKKTDAEVAKMQAGELIQFFVAWVSTVQEDIKKLQSRNIISKQSAKVFGAGVKHWADNLCALDHKLWNVAEIDGLYDRLVQLITANIDLNPERITIPGNYPFASNISGVHMEVRLISQENENKITFMYTSQSKSQIGSAIDKEMLKKVNKEFANIPWLKQVLHLLGKPINTLLPSTPHAETIWLVNHSQDLINNLLNNPSFLNLPPLNDEFPEIQLVQNLRLEIITSSSCCEEYCQHLFSALRLYLVQKNIHLPIVLYADSPYNPADKGYGSVHVINAKGKFIRTRVQCHTPHGKDLERLTLNLTEKETQDFTCLTLIGGFTLIELMKIGVYQMSDDYANPITYIPPDALIIYAADIILCDTHAKDKDKKIAKYLIETLENMSMDVLVSWRLMYLQQLHWLLISHLNPDVKDHVRSLAWASNINVASAITEHDFARYDEFCGKFFHLWKNPDKLHAYDLSDIYQKMLRYFTGHAYAAMPLGSTVGPLSMKMINRDAFFPAYTQHSLQQRRLQLILEDRTEDQDLEQDEVANNDSDDTVDISSFAIPDHHKSNITCDSTRKPLRK